ncbi:MAG: helix-turn-helix domain-containing protein, partial [Acidobacteriota bacterium]
MADLYTPRDAAERLGISYPTIKQWLYRGKLRAVVGHVGQALPLEQALDLKRHHSERGGSRGLVAEDIFIVI